MTNGEIVGRVRPYLSSNKRNPSEFLPMEFDFSTIRHFMQKRQQESTLFKRQIERVSTESQELKQYGKYRFDYAVSKSPFSDSGTRCMHQRPTTCPAIVQGKRMLNKNNTGYIKDSGPSTQGSVIYNRRALILSAIRTRPSTVHSEKQQAATKGSLLSNVTTPVYRLKVAGLSEGGGSVINQGTVNYNDVVLLPEDTCTIREFLADEEDKQSDVESVSYEPQRIMYRKPSVPVLVQIDAPDSSEGDSDDDSPPNRLSDTRPSSKGSPRQSPNKTSETRGRKKSPSASGREGNRGKTADTLSPASAGRRPSSVTRGRSKTTATGTGRDRRNNSGVRRTQLDESPTRLPLPGPHCWVDDVTVSSDVMGEEERGESPSIIINTHKVPFYRRPSDKILPDFLCPSSELKSRNIATKLWIRESSFLNADKIIPLI